LKVLETWCTRPPLFEADYKNKISISFRRPELCRCMYEFEEGIYLLFVFFGMKFLKAGGAALL
jgi:hypothetical protein